MTAATRYCLCGAALRVRSTPPAAANRIVGLFDEQHTGPEHGPATAVQAATARRRGDRKVT